MSYFELMLQCCPFTPLISLLLFNIVFLCFLPFTMIFRPTKISSLPSKFEEKKCVLRIVKILEKTICDDIVNSLFSKSTTMHRSVSLINIMKREFSIPPNPQSLTNIINYSYRTAQPLTLVISVMKEAVIVMIALYSRL